MSRAGALNKLAKNLRIALLLRATACGFSVLAGLLLEAPEESVGLLVRPAGLLLAEEAVVLGRAESVAGLDAVAVLFAAAGPLEPIEGDLLISEALRALALTARLLALSTRHISCAW